MRQSCFIANQSGRDILVAEWPYRDLPIMAIKGTTFSSWVYFLKQFPTPGSFYRKCKYFELS